MPGASTTNRIPPNAYVDRGVYMAEMRALRASTWHLLATTDELADLAAPLRKRVLDVELLVTHVDDTLEVTHARPRRDLEPARLEVIGRFVFVALAPSVPGLREYLGVYADVLDAVSPHIGRLVYQEAEIALANWKHCVEISLDDYHVPTVHPTTFGAGELMKLHQFVYRRDGMHSCYLKRRDADWQFDAFWTGLREGRFDETGYKIFNWFPNVMLNATYDMCGVILSSPVDHVSTSMQTLIFDWVDHPLSDEHRRGLIDYVATFLAEDRATCEGLQQSAEAVARDNRVPLLGKLEERLGWFHEAYLDLMTPAKDGR